MTTPLDEATALHEMELLALDTARTAYEQFGFVTTGTWTWLENGLKRGFGWQKDLITLQASYTRLEEATEALSLAGNNMLVTNADLILSLTDRVNDQKDLIDALRAQLRKAGISDPD